MANASSPASASAGEINGSHSVEITENSNQTTVVNSIDDVLERYMSASTPNLLFPFLASLTWIFDSQQNFVNSFSKSHKISTIFDFSLECSSPILDALPASSFYVGCLVGGISLATLADSRLGRKNTLIFSSFIMSLTAALTAFSPNLAVYAVLCFACGFARANVGTSAFVLSSELVSRRHRNPVSILTLIFSTKGFLTLPSIAFLNRVDSWRVLYLYTSIPSLFYSNFLHFFMMESPRWFLLKDEKKEAIATLKKLLPLIEIVSFSDLAVSRSDKIESSDLFSAARMLWEKRWALRRLGSIMIVSFGVGMMYFGMPFNLGSLNANLYISVALNAAAELLSAFIVFFLASALSRRSSMVVLMVVSGGCSLACTAIGGWLAVAVELVAFFGVYTAFSLEMIYSVELFPTCVRNSALAVVRTAVVLGGVAAPALVAAGRRRKFLSFGVFGIVIIFCGLFIVFLPETRGVR
ncbi:hypothetical protein IEQ34_001535 [Dendrobium chrysotoxum]|uniref:H(+)/Pi cotransporter n=1 Tax=Dendrobium chrysotoxum TaxID=161865 RepID=A0AAV7HM44_DENCH|nr:hypothetical protein IEQ34_001535 [Dendrobium chrysotoxum]